MIVINAIIKLGYNRMKTVGVVEVLTFWLIGPMLTKTNKEIIKIQKSIWKQKQEALEHWRAAYLLPDEGKIGYD